MVMGMLGGHLWWQWQSRYIVWVVPCITWCDLVSQALFELYRPPRGKFWKRESNICVTLVLLLFSSYFISPLKLKYSSRHWVTPRYMWSYLNHVLWFPLPLQMPTKHHHFHGHDNTQLYAMLKKQKVITTLSAADLGLSNIKLILLIVSKTSIKVPSTAMPQEGCQCSQQR